MLNRRNAIAGGLATALVGCSPIPTYVGPEVTRVVVQKAQRRLYLLNGTKVIKVYAIDLGFAPKGAKQISGDGKTPEGAYYIDRKNPKSSFHLSLGISYPNRQDVAEARALGLEPGGDIFIHGASGRFGQRGTDWTYGCIAVTNQEIEEIYSMVNEGTQVDLNP